MGRARGRASAGWCNCSEVGRRSSSERLVTAFAAEQRETELSSTCRLPAGYSGPSGSVGGNLEPPRTLTSLIEEHSCLERKRKTRHVFSVQRLLEISWKVPEGAVVESSREKISAF